MSLPTLKKGDIQATTVQEKSRLLRKEAFPKPRRANLSDILDYIYPNPLETLEEIAIDEIRRASLRAKPDKAAELDQILSRVVHILVRYRIELLRKLY